MSTERMNEMSTVQEYLKCPQCGGVYNHTVDTATNEQFDCCHRCGKKYKRSVAVNDDGKPRRDENGDWIYEVENCFGYGVVGAAGRNGITQCYLLSEPVSDTVRRNFEKLIRQESIDARRAYLTCWDEEQKKVIALYGPMPETFEEFLGEAGNDG